MYDLTMEKWKIKYIILMVEKGKDKNKKYFCDNSRSCILEMNLGGLPKFHTSNLFKSFIQALL